MNENEMTVETPVQARMGFKNNLKSAWSLYKQNFWTLIGFGVIAYVLVILAGILNHNEPKPLWSLIAAVGALLAVLSSMAMMLVLDGEKGFVSAFKGGVKRFLPYIWTYILVVFITTFGFVLFVIPGIILSVLMTFTSLVVVLQGKKGLQAIATSYTYAKGSWWYLVWNGLALGLLMGILTIPAVNIDRQFSKEFTVFQDIWGIFMGPFVISFLYTIYKDLGALKNFAEPDQKVVKRLRIYAIIGFVLFTGLIVILGRFASKFE